MLFIPGPLVALFTFPGVITHEVAHRLFCDVAGVPVYETRYFRFGNPAGYVRHGAVGNLRAASLIAVGPLLINTVLCALLTVSVTVVFAELNAGYSGFIPTLLMWLGLSIGMNAFPSNEDMTNLSTQVREARGKRLAWFGAKVFEILLRIANALRVLWFDLIYAALVSFAIPLLVLRLAS